MCHSLQSAGLRRNLWSHQIFLNNWWRWSFSNCHLVAMHCGGLCKSCIWPKQGVFWLTKTGNFYYFVLLITRTDIDVLGYFEIFYFRGRASDPLKTSTKWPLRHGSYLQFPKFHSENCYSSQIKHANRKYEVSFSGLVTIFGYVLGPRMPLPIDGRKCITKNARLGTCSR